MDDDLAARLHDAADVIRERAAELSSWSARIPASLEISEGDDEVIIRANPAIAPQARAFELGIRHPLNYPNQQRHNRWANTPYRPFLEKAVDETADRAAHKVSLVIEDWAYKLGCK